MARTRVALAIALMVALVVHAHTVSAHSDAAPTAPKNAYGSAMSLFEWARNKFSNMLDRRNSRGNLKSSAGTPTPTPASTPAPAPAPQV